MKNLNRLILVLLLTGFRFCPVQAQATILDETFLTEQSFNTFTPVSVTGAQTWNFNSQYGAVCSGYNAGQSFENEDWLISPAMDVSEMENIRLSFSHTRGNDAVLNVGVAQGWYKAFATAAYTGNPSTTQWVELQGLNQNVPSAWQFIPSGELVIPEAAQSENTRIAFRYMSSNSQSAMWEIKNVKVTGEFQGTNPGQDVAFKITNWNVEWLGCETFGPWDEEQQIYNVASAMLTMNSDIYCIQEVSNTVTNPSIQTLVSIMGSEQWGGAIAPSNTGDCNQRQGIIYKKSKVQLVSSMEMSSGSSAQGNSYYYNWSSGRFPSLYNVNLIAGTTAIPVSLVNIHAKAEDGNAMSYTRRLGGSEALKTILDGTNYNTKNVIIIGDFNDFLIGTTSEACGCTASPYENFMDDESNYTGITKDIIDVNTNWGIRPLIENIIISNELDDNYISGSAAQEITVPQSIDDYFYTTSKHLPVTATFSFSTLSSPDYVYNANPWTIYPNPVKNELNIAGSMAIGTATEIYDLTGRLMFSEKMSSTAINVSTLPAGIYIVRIGNTSGKFVKE